MNCPSPSDGRARSVERIGPSMRGLVLDDREDVLLAHDEELLALDLELGAGVLRVEDLVALLHVHRLALAVVENSSGTGCDDRPLLRLLLRGVREDDARLGHLLARRRSNDDPVAQRAQLRRRGSSGSQGCVPPLTAWTGRLAWLGTR